MPKGVYDRSQSKRLNKKEIILKAAIKVYGHYGFEGATIDKIALAAGVSPSLIIDHFGSKQGLVKAIASRAVEENLERVRKIDAIPGLTLRQRELRIHSILKPQREEWCLILGTLLVPNFQFQLRGEMSGYLQETHKAVLRHLDELKTPTDEVAFSFAYSTIGAHIGYIMAGREQDYQIAMGHLLDSYLRPEDELPHGRAALP